MNIKNVMIAGGGTLGSQIAWQTAFKGFDVIVYDAFEAGLEAGKGFHKQYAETFIAARGASQAEIDQTMARLRYTTDLSTAARDADLVSESVPESPEIKKGFYEELSAVARPQTIFTTNSSTMTPSEIVDAVGRPERFLALHFANPIWDANVGEVMGHPGTDPQIFEDVVAFARAIGMVPIPIHKEQNGYILNSLLVPFLMAALDLYFDDVADVEAIDRTWMISTGVKAGPCAVMDFIGMETIYNVAKLAGDTSGDERQLARAKRIKDEFVDQGRLGVKTGKGFYEYPNPSFLDPGFLQ